MQKPKRTLQRSGRFKKNQFVKNVINNICKIILNNIQ